MEGQQDLPSELRRSRLYRASVPAERLLPSEVLSGTSSNISLEEGLMGVLEVRAAELQAWAACSSPLTGAWKLNKGSFGVLF